MFFLTRGLPVLIELGLLIFCLIDCIQTPEGETRNLPKIGWIVLIVILPLVGAIAWLVAGRPRAEVRPGAGAAGRPVNPMRGVVRPSRPRPIGPDDDPEFLSRLGKATDDRDQALRRWEEAQRRREEQPLPGAADQPKDGAGPGPDDASPASDQDAPPTP